MACEISIPRRLRGLGPEWLGVNSVGIVDVHWVGQGHALPIISNKTKFNPKMAFYIPI